MDAASWFSVPSFVFLAVGIVAGAAAGHFLSPALGESKRLRSDLERMKHEHESYRSSVNSHFRKTADLVGQMTKSYAAVYDHLAGGARRFCDDAGSDAAIPFGPLPGALASPVIETAADAAVSDAATEEATAEEVAAEEVAEDFYAPEEASAEEVAADFAAAGDGTGELATEEMVSAYEEGAADETEPEDSSRRI